MVTKPGATARLVRTRVFPMVISVLFRLRAVRKFLFRTVSQIGVNYHGSPLSEGTAGAVQGGDRLPWVPTGPAADNFAPLASIGWQVHVYGPARDGVADACSWLGLPVHAFAWTAATERAGFKSGSLLLIRPDGYVALADAEGDPAPEPLFSEPRNASRNATRGGSNIDPVVIGTRGARRSLTAFTASRQNVPQASTAPTPIRPCASFRPRRRARQNGAA